MSTLSNTASGSYNLVYPNTLDELITSIRTRIQNLKINDVNDLFIKFGHNINKFTEIALKIIINNHKKPSENIDYNHIKTTISRQDILNLKYRILSCIIFYTFFSHLEKSISQNDLLHLINKNHIEYLKNHNIRNAPILINKDKIDKIIDLYKKEFRINISKTNKKFINASISALIIKLYNSNSNSNSNNIIKIDDIYGMNNINNPFEELYRTFINDPDTTEPSQMTNNSVNRKHRNILNSRRANSKTRKGRGTNTKRGNLTRTNAMNDGRRRILSRTTHQFISSPS
jgi:hypothetical protein